MMTAEISSVKPKSRQGFMSLLSSAACEWIMIFLLFVDAAFSYLLTKFALYCKLQTPCPLCSRIDHVFEKKKPGYLWSLFCSNHKEEISSLVCCDNHGKLADIHAMCEDCIMSLARSRKPTSESYRLSVGKLGVDIEDSGLKTPLLYKSFQPDSSGPRTCSCCSRLLRAKSNTQRLLQVNSAGYGASRVNVKPTLPRIPARSRFSRRDSMKKLRDKFVGPMSPRTAASTGVDQLSHVGYTELKITSDSDSEVPFSDEEDVTYAFRGKNDYYTEFHQGSQKLRRVDNDESGPSKEPCQTSEPVPSLLDQPVQLESIEQNSMISLGRGGFVQQNLEEINWYHPNPKPNSPPLPELISLDDVPQVADDANPNAFTAPPSNRIMLSELMSLNNALPPPSIVEVSEKSSDIAATSDARDVLLVKHTTITEFPIDRSTSTSNNLNSGDRLDLSNSERKASDMLAETLATSISEKPEEDLKSLPRLSSTGIDSSSKDTSPRSHNYNHDGFQRSDTLSSSDAVDMMQMAAALERHDSGHESTDGINVKEIEGETDLHWLKRQVDYDRRCMKALFKELEEERSAAAVAANQAMAMITRLQEEKASLHMEALQYLRMMEEQAEYDMEALEKANDLLAEKEKEMQDLEAELDIYRNKFLDDPVIDDPVIDDPCNGTSDTEGDKRAAEKYQAAHKNSPSGIDDPCEGTSGTEGDKMAACKYQTARIKSSPSAIDLSRVTNISENIYTMKQGSSLSSNFEDGKLYISKCLKKLELKLREHSRNKALTNLSNGGYSEKVIIEVDNEEEFLADEGTQTDHTKGEDYLSIHRDLTSLNGSLEKEESADFVEENHLVCEHSEDPDVHQFKLSSHGGEEKLDTFKSEITYLKYRLEALEADGDLLSHALSTLQNENDGLQFIQEIARQLQELRKLEFENRSLSIPEGCSTTITE